MLGTPKNYPYVNDKIAYTQAANAPFANRVIAVDQLYKDVPAGGRVGGRAYLIIAHSDGGKTGLTRVGEIAYAIAQDMKRADYK
jgi:hypothetical protein